MAKMSILGAVRERIFLSIKDDESTSYSNGQNNESCLQPISCIKVNPNFRWTVGLNEYLEEIDTLLKNTIYRRWNREKEKKP